MTWFSKLSTAFGLALLAHSCYSAQEFASFQSFRSAGTSQPASATLPVDIVFETIAALLTTSFGLVLGTQQLKPIQWHMWAGKIEREGRDKLNDSESEPDRAFAGNPFSFLESRPSFVDIRQQRKAFEGWVRGIGNHE